MTASYTPSKQEVVDFYDNAIPMINRLVGVNVHLGYWTSEEDTSTVQEATDRLTDLMVERLGVGPGDRVLDLGCGLGVPAIRLARTTGAAVVGVATSPKLITEARANAEAAGLAERVGFELADAADLPFPAASFDAVLAIESIVHMADQPQVFAEVARVLKPGGRIVLTDFFTTTGLDGERLRIVEDYRRLSLNSELLKVEDYPPLLRAAGLHVTEYLDITRQTSRHHREMIEAVGRQRPELEPRYGKEMLDTFVSVFERCLEISEPGYLLLTAERRDTT
jgi:cyclopropane fatty-acyl-phospholipid synthase-like methyltransferase